MKKLIVMLVLGAMATASAVEVVRKDINTNSIATVTNAWVSGYVPTASDVAVWNSSLANATLTNSLGANTSWQGIRVGSALNKAATLNAAGTELLTLGSSGIDMTSAAFDFTIGTKVGLGSSQTWAVKTARTLAVRGEISGASGNVLTKNDLGTLTLGGANTYSGGTVLNDGTLNLTNNGALGSGTLTINGGTLRTASGSTNDNEMIINNNFVANNDQYRTLIAGGKGISLGTSAGSSRTITVVSNIGAFFIFKGAISDGTTANQLIKSGGGALGLFGTNTYTGGTVLNEGDLYLNNSASLGSGIFTINGGSINVNTLTATGQVTLVNAGMVINNGFIVNRVTGGGTKVIDFGTGSISLGSNGTSRTLSQGSSSAIYIRGAISDGTGGSKKLILSKSESLTGSAGTLYLNGTSSYSGGTEISGLNVTVSNQYALGTGGLTISHNSTNYATKLTLLNSLNIDGLLSSGTSVSTNFTGIDLGAQTLTLNQSGNSEYGLGIMGSAGKLVKSGLGTLTLSGTNTYTGATTVSGGKLIVNSLFNKSMITVQNGGTLGGTGSLKAVTLTAGAILAVGNSPGTMTFDGAVLLSPGSTNLMEIFTSGFDVMKGAATNKLTLAGVNLFDFAGNTVTNGATFTVFQNWGSIVNSNAVFTGINMGAGQGVTVDITGGTGVVTVIPEPAVVGLLSLGAIITLLARRIHR